MIEPSKAIDQQITTGACEIADVSADSPATAKLLAPNTADDAAIPVIIREQDGANDFNVRILKLSCSKNCLWSWFAITQQISLTIERVVGETPAGILAVASQ